MNKSQSWIVAVITTTLLSTIAYAAASKVQDTTTQITTPCSGYLEVGQAGQKQLAFQRDVSAGETITLDIDNVGAIYTATLKGNDGVLYYGNGTDAITLDPVFTWEEEERTPNAATVQFEVESNNSIKKANILTGDTIYGRIAKKLLIKDVDYFKITIAEPGNYAFILDQIPTGVDYDLYLYNESGKQIASSSGVSQYEIVKLEDISAGDVYYAMVSGYTLKDYDAQNSYRVQYTSYTPTSDDFGNTIANAHPIELLSEHTEIAGSIDYPKDVDMFELQPTNSDVYVLYTGGNLDTVGKLYDASGSLLAENDDGDNWNFKISYELLTGEAYYLSVAHEGAGTGAYTLCIDSPSQAAVPGDSFETAITISTEEGATESFSSENEVWYFQFTPEQTGSYGIFSTGNAIDTYGMLYKSDKTTILAENDNAGGDNHFWVANTLLAGEVYYLTVSSHVYKPSSSDFSIYVEQYDLFDDPMADMQYHVLNTETGLDVNLLPAWELAAGDGVRVAVADSGIYFEHEYLKNNLDLGLSYNFIHSMPNIFPIGEDTSSDSAVTNGHGTHVAGIIAASANNELGTVGIAPNAQMIGYKVLGTRISGESYTGSITAFVNAIAAAQEQGIYIMNCSFGGSSASALEMEAMENAPEILFVISAGNSGVNLEENPQYPACYYLDQSVVVANIDKNGELAWNSNYGGPTAIAAPGEDILSTMPYNDYGLMSGTSMAAPMVTGVAALVSSELPSLTTTELKNILVAPENTTQLANLNGSVSSMGMVNAWKTVTSTPSTVQGRSSNAREVDRNPFSGRDVKSVITEVMYATDDSEKTGNLIVKVVPNTDFDQLLALVTTETNISFELVGATAIENAYEIQASSVEDADELVQLFNIYDEVQYAEPNYIRK